jgi:hypothetical protein
VHPVVDRPIEAVAVALDASVPQPVLVRHHFLRVDLQVAVRVAHEPQLAWLADEDPAIEHLERAGQYQPVRKDRALVHHAVVVRVLEHRDVADWIQIGFRCLQIAHVPGHLDDPDPPLEIPVHHDGILHERLAGDELDVIARRHVEALHGVGGRQHRGLVRDLLHAGRPLTVRRRALGSHDAGHRHREENRDRAESGEHDGYRLSEDVIVPRCVLPRTG